MYGDTNLIKLENGTEANGIKVVIAYPPKEAVVRMPTSDEMAILLNQYLEQSKQKNKKLSDEQQEEQQRKFDVELFKNIKLAGDDFDEFESELVIAHLTQYALVSTEKDADGYTVTITTPFGEVLHMLRPLTLKELATWRTAVNRGQQNWKGNTVLSLYNTLVRTTEGYAAGVEAPPTHRNMAMTAVAAAVNVINPLQISPNA